LKKLENEILFHTKKKKFTATCFLSFSISIFGAETICQMAIAEKVEKYVYADAWQFFKVSVY
jgi:hypothetical protein